LTSKLVRKVISSFRNTVQNAGAYSETLPDYVLGGKVSKIEYGNVDFEKVIIETVTSTQR